LNGSVGYEFAGNMPMLEWRHPSGRGFTPKVVTAAPEPLPLPRIAPAPVSHNERVRAWQSKAEPRYAWVLDAGTLWFRTYSGEWHEWEPSWNSLELPHAEAERL